MAKLSPDAQTLIDAARGAHDPTPEARVRGDAAVRVALAMHGLTDLPPLDPATASTTAQAGSAGATSSVSGGLALKVALGMSAAAILASSLFAAYTPARRPAISSQTGTTPITVSPVAAAPSQPTLATRQGVQTDRTLTITRERERRTARRLVLAQQATPHASAAQAPVTIADEVRLISAANSHVLASRYDKALRILDRHARRFPRGALREERTALRVLSLCGSAADARAQRERARFLSNSPQSVLTERVRAACATADEDSP
jgi:hypothetical protein